MRPIAAHIDEFEPDLYIQALVAVASCDGMTNDELDFIKGQAQMLGIDPAAALAAPVMVHDVSRAMTQITRKLVYRDCYVLASIDGAPNARERDILGQLQSVLGLTPEVCAKIEDWMNRYSALLEEGEALLADA